MEVYSRKKSECELVRIWDDPVLYIPASFNNPISFPNSCLKANVPLWIEVNNNDCIVIILQDDFNIDDPDDVQKLLALVSDTISSYRPQTGR